MTLINTIVAKRQMMFLTVNQALQKRLYKKKKNQLKLMLINLNLYLKLIVHVLFQLF